MAVKGLSCRHVSPLYFQDSPGSCLESLGDGSSHFQGHLRSVIPLAIRKWLPFHSFVNNCITDQRFSSLLRRSLWILCFTQPTSLSLNVIFCRRCKSVRESPPRTMYIQNTSETKSTPYLCIGLKEKYGASLKIMYCIFLTSGLPNALSPPKYSPNGPN